METAASLAAIFAGGRKWRWNSRGSGRHWYRRTVRAETVSLQPDLDAHHQWASGAKHDDDDDVKSTRFGCSSSSSSIGTTRSSSSSAIWTDANIGFQSGRSWRPPCKESCNVHADPQDNGTAQFFSPSNWTDRAVFVIETCCENQGQQNGVQSSPFGLSTGVSYHMIVRRISTNFNKISARFTVSDFNSQKPFEVSLEIYFSSTTKLQNVTVFVKSMNPDAGTVGSIKYQQHMYPGIPDSRARSTVKSNINKC
uniref:Genomic DNA, chromosome 3, clone:P0043E01 n=1 Tax=Oryza sativa subsp. japonica TaxID=39947 RepID=Q9SNI8_ORYSJ|nr:unnamed protein product [Oryza sativa Japonica Group]